MKFHVSLTDLKKDLKSFGLNPADWILEKRPDRQIRLYHREDREFSLIGWVARTRLTNRYQWDRLVLASI